MKWVWEAGVLDPAVKQIVLSVCSCVPDVTGVTNILWLRGTTNEFS